MSWRGYLFVKKNHSKKYQLYKARKENPDYVWTKQKRLWTFLFLFFWYPFTFIKWISVEIIGGSWFEIIVILIFLGILGGVIAFIVFVVVVIAIILIIGFFRMMLGY